MCCSVTWWSRASMNVASGGGAEERDVDEVPHAGRGGGVDERAVLVEPVLRLRGRDHQHRRRARPAPGVRRRRSAYAACATVAPRQRRRPRRVRTHQPLLDARGGEQPGDPAAEAAGGAGDAEHHRLSPPSRSRRPAPPGGRAGRARSRAPRGRRAGRTAPARPRRRSARPRPACPRRPAPSRAGSSSRRARVRGEPVRVAGGRLGRGRRAVQHLDLVALAAAAACPSRRGR